jgi:hypothetical protein
MSKAYIVSTVTSDIRIVEYASQLRQNDVPVIKRGFTIKGGANRAAPKTLLTQDGVLTPVSALDLSWLMQNGEFQRQVREGWMTLITDDRDVNRALRDLQAKDGCAPLVDGDKRLDKARKVYVGDELPDGEVKAA